MWSYLINYFNLKEIKVMKQIKKFAAWQMPVISQRGILYSTQIKRKNSAEFVTFL